MLKVLRDIILLEKEERTRQERQFPEVAWYLIERSDHDVFTADEIDNFYYWGPSDSLSWIMQRHKDLGNELSEYQCNMIALGIARRSHEPNIASLIKVALQGRQINDFLRNQTYLLHFAVENLGQYCAALLGLEREYEGRSSTVEVLDRADPGMGEGIEEWNIPNRNELLRLIRNLVSGSPLLHRLNSLGRTPLLSMIFRYFYPHQPISIRGYSPVLRTAISENELSSQCGAVVRVWLEQLKESKIDLVKYGEAEHHLHYAMAEEIGKEGSIDWQKIRGSQLQPMSSTFRLLEPSA
jgi:hypothetical protein